MPHTDESYEELFSKLKEAENEKVPTGLYTLLKTYSENCWKRKEAGLPVISKIKVNGGLLSSLLGVRLDKTTSRTNEQVKDLLKALESKGIKIQFTENKVVQDWVSESKFQTAGMTPEAHAIFSGLKNQLNVGQAMILQDEREQIKSVYKIYDKDNRERYVVQGTGEIYNRSEIRMLARKLGQEGFEVHGIVEQGVEGNYANLAGMKMDLAAKSKSAESAEYDEPLSIMTVTISRKNATEDKRALEKVLLQAKRGNVNEFDIVLQDLPSDDTKRAVFLGGLVSMIFSESYVHFNVKPREIRCPAEYANGLRGVLINHMHTNYDDVQFLSSILINGKPFFKSALVESPAAVLPRASANHLALPVTESVLPEGHRPLKTHSKPH